ncbi:MULTISPECIES: UDP-N-acetylmuramoyl-L-alanyl-D-glutamate--2,6-diaminopimelate ligase [Methylomonas]|uniref:UDP-N-acetylmuramoyl-L-alanyl-D-glutamate--2, 6-diaminopimelate ligase n=1 Tax=Methylomonas TaxID=416 RepID=UPI001232BFC4|nr:UDP-N-acetylmuramoyl-L-alanyl-D-glutamate--2,6-diaminopimelate ligase [Methylomonas rhizoryzae]
MRLSVLLEGLADLTSDCEVGGLCLDSRQLQSGQVFIALNGALQHGLSYAGQAAAAGAAAIVYDPEGSGGACPQSAEVPMVAVDELGRLLGEIAARFYAYPSRRLEVVGITGTNGKTTCSQLLAQALADCGVIGTLGWGRIGNLHPTVNTTPDALAVQRMLHDMAAIGLKRVAMEVSSHGLHQGRVNAVDFVGAVFTNLSRDHLDYHGDMDSYLQAKLSLFNNPALQFAVINLDDPNSGEVSMTLSPTVRRWGFSVTGKTVPQTECVQADQVVHSNDGIRFRVTWQNLSQTAYTPVVGAFNLQNVLTVMSVLLAMGWPFAPAVERLAHLRPVTGRMEKFGAAGQPQVIIDYAHTPDALEKVLLASKGSGKLWVVFGCGGDRDKGKRPEMGRIAEVLADRVILTDDNPRSEPAYQIINDILAGCLSDKVSIINDRHRAITTAIKQAQAEDCVVIAGKGHENYQDIEGRKIPFSDQEAAVAALQAWGAPL